MSLVVKDISLDDWQRAIARAPFVPLQQSWGYGSAAKDLGAKVTRLGIYDDDGERLIAIAQLTHKKIAKLVALSLCMRGPLWLGDVSEAQKTQAYRALRKHRFYSLWMPESPDDKALHAAKAKRVMTGYHTVMLDLSQELDSLRAKLDGKWRNRLVAAEGEKISIKRLTQAADYRFVLKAETVQSSAKHYAALSPAFVPLYQMQLGDKAVLALEARSNHTPIAAIICLLHDGCATYHIGWSNAEGKQRSAHNLLLWRAMTALKARGVRWLDLGGVNTEAEGAGIARFKIGTGGQVVSLDGTYF